MALRYTEEQARAAIAASLTFTEALRRLGMCWSGGNYRTLRKWAANWSIPTDHFDPDAARRRALRREAVPLAEVLVENSTYSRGSLKDPLYESGLKARVCELCGQGELWHGNAMSLILDHVNGDARDNRRSGGSTACRTTRSASGFARTSGSGRQPVRTGAFGRELVAAVLEGDERVEVVGEGEDGRVADPGVGPRAAHHPECRACAGRYAPGYAATSFRCPASSHPWRGDEPFVAATTRS